MKLPFLILIYLVRPRVVFAQWYKNMIVDAAVQCSCDRESGLNVSEVTVHVYNYDTNSSDVYYINDAASKIISRNDFDIDQCIDIFVPGYNTDVNDDSLRKVRCILSQITCNGKHTLAVIFNHYEYTKMRGNSSLGYKVAVKYVKSIGQRIGEVIVGLLKSVFVENISIAGFSLGAQMVGNAAETVKAFWGPLPIIYAIDSAGPCFSNCLKEHVRSGQANIVVAIHCSNVGGTTAVVADYDVYANDGETQSGCYGMTACSHNICIPIALEPSVSNNIWNATRCSSYDNYKNGKCSVNDTMLAGYRKYPTTSAGVFYFTSDYLICN